MNNFKEQFSQIYDQYIDKIYRFVYLKVNSQETAQDITSKVFIKGWEAYQKQAKNSDLKIQNESAFLYQIARNEIIDYYRDKGRTNIVSVDNSPEIIDSETNVHEKAILSADVDNIKKAIKKLKQEYQDIIIWHYLEDMSIAEIAKLMNKPAGTVRVMLHRGLKELKNIVQEA